VFFFTNTYDYKIVCIVERIGTTVGIYLQAMGMPKKINATVARHAGKEFWYETTIGFAQFEEDQSVQIPT
jgi:hypothetical protein